MEKITKPSNSVPQERAASSVSPGDASRASQTGMRKFSSLMKNSETETKAPGRRTPQEHLSKGLSSVQRRLDQDLQTQQAHHVAPHPHTGKSIRRDKISRDPETHHVAPDPHPGKGSDRGGASKLRQGAALPDVTAQSGKAAHLDELGKNRNSDVAETSPSGLMPEMGPVVGAASPAPIEASPASPDSPPATHDIGKIARQLAERILVTPPGSSENQEVRIQLKASVLDGSDVRIFREDGELKVVFVANTKDAENFIAQNKGQIEQVLGDRLKDERIQISVESPQGGATQGEHNEGRSRQRYLSPDDESTDDLQN